MTGNAKSEALEQHELSSEELEAVSGGAPKDTEKTQSDAVRNYERLLQEIS
jgi:hypothetical protein